MRKILSVVQSCVTYEQLFVTKNWAKNIIAKDKTAYITLMREIEKRKAALRGKTHEEKN